MLKPAQPTEGRSRQVLAILGETGARGDEYGSAGGRVEGSWRGHAGAGLLCSDVIAVLPLSFLVSLGVGLFLRRGRRSCVEGPLVSKMSS